jgi:predicted  nucleic acid-binding Zn-ribbon protein
MASLALQRLHGLHEIDAAMFQLRQRAAAFKPAAAESAALEIEAPELEKAIATYREAHAEATDLELSVATTQTKIEKLEATLFSPGTAARDVELMNRELASLKKQREEQELRLLELLEEMPQREEAMKRAEARQLALRQAVARAKANGKSEAEAMNAEYAALGKRRPEALNGQDPALLAKYESIRQKYGTGMADVKRPNQCGACGTLLPERAITSLRDDKVVTCESCYRLLYYTEGLV